MEQKPVILSPKKVNHMDVLSLLDIRKLIDIFRCHEALVFVVD